MNKTNFSSVNKIAVFRATALGDFIFALPALEALHDTYPQAELVYLGRAWHADFVPGRLPGQHRVIALPPAQTNEDIRQGLVVDPLLEVDLLRPLRAEQFDLALQMHGGGEYSNPFVLALGARHTVGLKSPRAVALERWTPYQYYQNETARMLEVVSLAGALPSSLQPCLPVLERDLVEAAPILEMLRGPFVVIHPGSTDPRRCWSPVKFAGVGDYCASQGLAVVLTGTELEAERIQAVAAEMHAPALNLCGRLSLAGLVGLLSRAALFIGNDSGPLHIAHAVGAPTVGLFWVEYMLNSLPLMRQNFYPLIAWSRFCPRCGQYLDKAEADQPYGPCMHDVSLVEEIRPEDVIQAAGVMLSAQAN